MVGHIVARLIGFIWQNLFLASFTPSSALGHAHVLTPPSSIRMGKSQLRSAWIMLVTLAMEEPRHWKGKGTCSSHEQIQDS